MLTGMEVSQPIFGASRCVNCAGFAFWALDTFLAHGPMHAFMLRVCRRWASPELNTRKVDEIYLHSVARFVGVFHTLVQVRPQNTNAMPTLYLLGSPLSRQSLAKVTQPLLGAKWTHLTSPDGLDPW